MVSESHRGRKPHEGPQRACGQALSPHSRDADASPGRCGAGTHVKGSFPTARAGRCPAVTQGQAARQCKDRRGVAEFLSSPLKEHVERATPGAYRGQPAPFPRLPAAPRAPEAPPVKSEVTSSAQSPGATAAAANASTQAPAATSDWLPGAGVRPARLQGLRSHWSGGWVGRMRGELALGRVPLREGSGSRSVGREIMNT